MIVQFEITAEDDREGVPNRCAAARAIKRKLPGRDVKVWYEAVCIDGVEIPSPPALSAFVARYDEEPGLRGGEPVVFELDVPEARP